MPQLFALIAFGSLAAHRSDIGSAKIGLLGGVIVPTSKKTFVGKYRGRVKGRNARSRLGSLSKPQSSLTLMQDRANLPILRQVAKIW